jgi:hypothetical protein
MGGFIPYAQGGVNVQLQNIHQTQFQSSQNPSLSFQQPMMMSPPFFQSSSINQQNGGQQSSFQNFNFNQASSLTQVKNAEQFSGNNQSAQHIAPKFSSTTQKI